jgi:hypothetical protein
MNNDEEKSYRIGVSQLSEKLGYANRRTFWRRVESCKGAEAELSEAGYIKGQKEFTPKQMKIICDRIGYPEE